MNLDGELAGVIFDGSIESISNSKGSHSDSLSG